MYILDNVTRIMYILDNVNNTILSRILVSVFCNLLENAFQV
jgi:hypothetical protein